jgi:hypothetical protein
MGLILARSSWELLEIGKFFVHSKSTLKDTTFMLIFSSDLKDTFNDFLEKQMSGLHDYGTLWDTIKKDQGIFNE